MNPNPTRVAPARPKRPAALAHGGLTAIALALLFVAGNGSLPSAHAQTREPVTLNFVGAEIESVARTMAAIAYEAERSQVYELDRDFINQQFARVDQTIAMAALFAPPFTTGCRAS